MSEQKVDRKTRKIARRARHRLLSIHHDVETFLKPLLQFPSLDSAVLLPPIIANERCGSWYAYPIQKFHYEQYQQHQNLQTKEGLQSFETTKSSSSSLPSSSSLTSSPTAFTPFPTCYFKSSDGHVNTWNFSLKRLNLSILEHVARHGSACIIIDSSNYKVLPDSFSRTIPIWAAVVNRITCRYRSEMRGKCDNDDASIIEEPTFWDRDVHTPDTMVPLQEQEMIRSILDDRAELLYQSGAIVDPIWLVSTHKKPLRTRWITPDICGNNEDSVLAIQERILEYCNSASKYYNIICINGSRVPSSFPKLMASLPSPSLSIMSTFSQTKSLLTTIETKTNVTTMLSTGGTELTNISSNPVHDDPNHAAEDTASKDNCCNYFYTPGAADDQESWAQKLTADLFWENISSILHVGQEQLTATDASAIAFSTGHVVVDIEDKETTKRIDDIVKHAKEHQDEYLYVEDNSAAPFDWIGNTNIAIGTRRAGRPPKCWDTFDAILNVSEQQYSNIMIATTATATNDQSAKSTTNASDNGEARHSSEEKSITTSIISANSCANASSVKNDENPSSQHRRIQNKGTDHCSRYYLNLPVAEGKRDKAELENWMSIGIVFLLVHAGFRRRKVLVHCAQGKDRSVAVVMATLAVGCSSLKLPLQFHSNIGLENDEMETLIWKKLDICVSNDMVHQQDKQQSPQQKFHPQRQPLNKNISLWDAQCLKNKLQDQFNMGPYKDSGLPKFVVESFFGRPGKDRFMHWITSEVFPHRKYPLATKESLRLALLLIQHDRENAAPTRKTFQKLHRFFMSDSKP